MHGAREIDWDCGRLTITRGNAKDEYLIARGSGRLCCGTTIMATGEYIEIDLCGELRFDDKARFVLRCDSDWWLVELNGRRFSGEGLRASDFNRSDFSPWTKRERENREDREACREGLFWFALVASLSAVFLVRMTLNHTDGTPVPGFFFTFIGTTSLVIASGICAGDNSLYFFVPNLLWAFVAQIGVLLLLGVIAISVANKA